MIAHVFRVITKQLFCCCQNRFINGVNLLFSDSISMKSLFNCVSILNERCCYSFYILFNSCCSCLQLKRDFCNVSFILSRTGVGGGVGGGAVSILQLCEAA